MKKKELCKCSIKNLILSFIPYLPGVLGLEVEHFEAAYCDGALGSTLAEEEGLGWVVDTVEEEVLLGEEVVWYVGTGVGVGVHAEWGAVDYDRWILGENPLPAFA